VPQNAASIFTLRLVGMLPLPLHSPELVFLLLWITDENKLRGFHSSECEDYSLLRHDVIVS
jgi:hypothetical protein